jgi:putative membrane protein
MTAGARRTARLFLIVHASLIAASVTAFFLIVDRPIPAGFDPKLWATAYAIGMAWTGPLYIVTGFLAALAGFGAVAGRRSALLVAAAVIVASLAVELLGTSTGLPFGAYGYGDQLGLKVAGLVPVVIPLSWFLMLYASLGIGARLTSSPGKLIVLGALGLVAWDVLMDPTMSAVFPFWSWHTGGVYYGMPLVNWFGWFVTGLLLAFLAVRLDLRAIQALRDERLPVVLYILNGLFPLALAFKAGLIGVILVGGAAMTWFVALPLLVRGIRRTAPHASLRQA